MRSIQKPLHHYTFETTLLIISSFFIFIISLFDHKITFDNATLFTITIMVLTAMVKGGSVFVGGAVTRFFWQKLFKKKDEK